jgi:hypothetical protein
VKTSFNLSYRPLPGGGIKLTIADPSVNLSIPLDRGLALDVAASILHGAGVSEATFSGGRLSVLSSKP